MMQHRGPGFVHVAMASELRQQRETDVHVDQGIALDQATESHRFAVCLALHEVQPETVQFVHATRTFANVDLRFRQVVHVPVADEMQPVRIIDESQDERGITRFVQLAQAESRGLQSCGAGCHDAASDNGATVR